MPLLRRRGNIAFQRNVRAEVRAGKPVKQAVAIAYAIARSLKPKK